MMPEPSKPSDEGAKSLSWKLADERLHGFDFKAQPVPSIQDSKLSAAFLTPEFVRRQRIPSTDACEEEKRSLFFSSKVAAFFQLLFHCANVCGYSKADKWWCSVSRSVSIQGSAFKKIVHFLQAARVAGRLRPEFVDGWTVASQSADLWLQFLAGNEPMEVFTAAELDHVLIIAQKFIMGLKLARSMETAGLVMPSIHPIYWTNHNDPNLPHRFLRQDISNHTTVPVRLESLDSIPSISSKRPGSPLSGIPRPKHTRNSEDDYIHEDIDRRDVKDKGRVYSGFFIDLGPHKNDKTSIEPRSCSAMASTSSSKATGMLEEDVINGESTLTSKECILSEGATLSDQERTWLNEDTPLSGEGYASRRVSLSPTVENYHGRIPPFRAPTLMTKKQTKTINKKKSKKKFECFMETITDEIVALKKDMPVRLGQIETDVVEIKTDLAEIKESLAALAAARNAER